MKEKKIKTVSRGLRMPEWLWNSIPRLASAADQQLYEAGTEAFVDWIAKHSGSAAVLAVLEEQAAKDPEMRQVFSFIKHRKPRSA